MKNYLEALKLIQNEVSVMGTQKLDTKSASGVTAEDALSKNPVPEFSNSAMDGYCLSSADTKSATSDNPVELKINTIIFAGDESPPIKDGLESYEIMTGSKMPDGMDTVLPYEKGTVIEKNGCQLLVVNEPIIKGANVRKSGEDFQKDELILSKGTLINDYHKIGLIMNNQEKIKIFIVFF